MTPSEQAFVEFIAAAHQDMLIKAANLAAANAQLRAELEAAKKTEPPA